MIQQEVRDLARSKEVSTADCTDYSDAAEERQLRLEAENPKSEADHEHDHQPLQRYGSAGEHEREKRGWDAEVLEVLPPAP